MDSAQTPATAVANPARKKALGAIVGSLLAIAAAYGVYWALVASHYESTDNAYVQSNVVQITPQVAGTVLAIGADETDYVRPGQSLLKLDPSDARVALDQAEAQLAQTVREVRALYATNEVLKAQVALREADLGRAQVDYEKEQDDVNRRSALVSTGAVGSEEFRHATAQLAATKSAQVAAQASVMAAREQLLANEALTGNTTVAQHPNVKSAAARVREAYLALRRAELPSPVAGYVAKRSVQLGQRVQPGQPVMTVVALDQPWVDANFKESQLRKLRIGQPVKLVADVYGKRVDYHGVVAGLGAGTGSAFALLPAQNATGNWIKIVQRLPVRITLDHAEVAAHPLRVGLSMDVTVDVSRTDGKMLADEPRRGVVAATAVFDRLDGEADELVQRIVNDSLAAAAARQTAQTRQVPRSPPPTEAGAAVASAAGPR